MQIGLIVFVTQLALATMSLPVLRELLRFLKSIKQTSVHFNEIKNNPFELLLKIIPIASRQIQVADQKQGMGSVGGEHVCLMQS